MSHSTGTDGSVGDQPHKAGAFDVRNVIGGLIGFYGLVLLLVALFGEDQTEKTGGVDANLWAGLGMIAFGLGFALWSRLRPVVVYSRGDMDMEGEGRGH
jgi:hypothetical protein